MNLRILYIVLILSLTVLGDGYAKKIKRLPIVKAEEIPVFVEDAVLLDTICDGDISLDKILLSGYNKPKNSLQETLFVKNDMPTDIRGIIIELEYFNPEGEQLHKRKVNISCEIPPGEKRMVEFRSWDRQMTYFYIHGQHPRKDVGRPYDIKYRVVGVYRSSL